MHNYESNTHFGRIHCSGNSLLILVETHLGGDLHVHFERIGMYSVNHFFRKRKSL